MTEPACPPVRPLDAHRLFTACDPNQFIFETTAEIDFCKDVIGQDRAVEAIRFAIGVRHPGYNLFVLGAEGTGKYSLVRRFLEDTAQTQPVPDDWCYVHNFADPHRPTALRVPAGRARRLRTAMAHVIDDLVAGIPAAFESDDYRHRRAAIDEELKKRHEATFERLQQQAKEQGVVLTRTPTGLMLAPVRNGELIKPAEFEAMPEAEKARIKAALEEIQKGMEETMHEVPKWEKEHRDRVRELNRSVTERVVAAHIGEIRRDWLDVPAVLAHLDAVHSDVVENTDDFLPKASDEGESALPPAVRRAMTGGGPFRRYRVNVMVEHGCPDDSRPPDAEARECAGEALAGAPVIYEDHPTLANLIGRIEQMSQFGTLVTDFNLIKAGALHRANGGYLILDARRLLMAPMAWETLTRALRARHIRIESAIEAVGWPGTATLEPEPIPLDVKVVLLGPPLLYYLLSRHEPEFLELFKVAADFETRMPRTAETALQYARLIATLAQEEGLRPLDRGAVARVVEHGSRLAGDAERMSTHMGTIVDLVREADHFARQSRSKQVRAAHVQRAIDAKVRRSDRLRERVQEEIERGTIVIETSGARVGQVNGLSVVELDSFSFGQPNRISCRVRLGKGEVIDIEREVALGGPLHSKGVLILSSYLSSRFARDHPLSLSASLVFEQSYGGVDGDSASSAELYALLSALAEVPIRQGLAVTGSVDQAGRVQAIGGVNEKIEGFFDVCRRRGLDGSHGVLIPAANVKHLMLRSDVVAAAARGQFHVYPVETIEQGIALLTETEAGISDDKGTYPIGSVYRAVANRLVMLARRAREQQFEAQRLGRGGNNKARD